MSRSKRKTPGFLKTRRRLPRLAYAAAVGIVRLWRRTCPLEINDRNNVLATRSPWPVVFVLWHNRLFFLPDCFPEAFRTMSVTLASKSRDGEHAARFIREFGFHEVVRGSTSKGGTKALLRLRRHIRAGRSVVLTVDGPRGPRYQVQQGAAVLAALTGAPVLPIGFNAPRRWELGAWDRTQLPRPFCPMELVIGDPIRIRRDALRSPEEACRRIRDGLVAITSDLRDVPLPGRLRWTFAPGVAEDVRRGLENGGWRPYARLLKANRRRSVFRVAGAAGLPRLIVKVDRPAGVLHRLGRVVRAKADSEFRTLQALRERGIPAVEPLAWARCGAVSVMVTRELAGMTPISAAWEDVRLHPERRAGFLRDLAGFMRILRRHRVLHPDLHVGNVLTAPSGAGSEARWRFVLLDTVGVRFGKRPLRPVHVLGWMMQIAELPPRERWRFMMEAGFADSARSARDLWRNLLGWLKGRVFRRWAGRRRRLLRESSLCRWRRNAEGRWLLYGSFPFDAARTALDAHCRAWTDAGDERNAGVADRAEIVKNDRKRRLTRTATAAGDVVVKEYRQRLRFRGPFARDRCAWLTHYRLRMLCIPAPEARCWLRRPDGTGLVMTEDAGRLHLKQALREAPPAERRALLAQAGRLAAHLHAVGVVHRDLKTSNLIVRPVSECPGDRLMLVDLDDVQFVRRVRPKARRQVLEVLLDSLPEEVSVRDRLFALAAYRLYSGFDRAGFRRLVRDLVPGAFIASVG